MPSVSTISAVTVKLLKLFYGGEMTMESLFAIPVASTTNWMG